MLREKRSIKDVLGRKKREKKHVGTNVFDMNKFLMEVEHSIKKAVEQAPMELVQKTSFRFDHNRSIFSLHELLRMYLNNLFYYYISLRKGEKISEEEKRIIDVLRTALKMVDRVYFFEKDIPYYNLYDEKIDVLPYKVIDFLSRNRVISNDRPSDFLEFEKKGKEVPINDVVLMGEAFSNFGHNVVGVAVLPKELLYKTNSIEPLYYDFGLDDFTLTFKLDSTDIDVAVPGDVLFSFLNSEKQHEVKHFYNEYGKTFGVDFYYYKPELKKLFIEKLTDVVIDGDEFSSDDPVMMFYSLMRHDFDEFLRSDYSIYNYMMNKLASFLNDLIKKELKFYINDEVFETSISFPSFHEVIFKLPDKWIYRELPVSLDEYIIPYDGLNELFEEGIAGLNSFGIVEKFFDGIDMDYFTNVLVWLLDDDAYDREMVLKRGECVEITLKKNEWFKDKGKHIEKDTPLKICRK